MNVRILALLFFCAFLLDGNAQRKIINGRVQDHLENSVPNVHVRNETIQKITVSDQFGQFRMPAQTGDTLRLTSVGFEELIVIVEESWFDHSIDLTMNEGSIELDELTISSIPSIEEFKERVMNLKLKDSAQFWYFGVAEPVFKGDQMVQGKKYKSPLYALVSPINFLHYNTSKKEKEKRKYYKITQTQPVQERAFKKFTRDWVKKETGLEGNELTSFIAFCNFDIHYLDRTSLYLIKEEMMAKLEEFQEKGKG